MVIEQDGLYQCEVCDLWYPEESLAADCEAFCREHNACSTEITRQAVDGPET